MSTVQSTICSGVPYVPHPNRGESVFSATEAQLEVWLSSSQSVEANCAYNEICSLIFHGALDVDVLRHSIEKVVQRHASLRSTFSADGSEVIVNEDPVFGFEILDLTGLKTEKLERELVAVVQDQARTPFDLVKGPLVRCVLQKLDDQNKLTVTAHHLVLDGWSLGIFCRDLGHFYDKLVGVPREALPPANHYREYAREMDKYLESESGKQDEAFWLETFNDQIPVLDLPIEGSRPALRTYYARRYDHRLSAELVSRLRKVGAKSGCSLFNVMLTAFNAWVARISGCDDFCVGIPTAGQAAMDQPQLMGHCVNTMPLRTRVDLDRSFPEYMKLGRTELLDALEHQRYSYGTLLRKLAPPRDPSRPPMLAVSFNVDPMIDTSDLGFGSLDVDVLVEPRSFENFEWFINGVILADESIEMQVQYNSDLFSDAAMKFYFEGFEAFLEDVVRRPDERLANLNTMSIRQRSNVIADWNENPLQYPAEATLDREFSRQASTTPDKVAVEFEEVALTYGEVESQSNQIARYLSKQGVGKGDLVGICVNRSEQMLVLLYGIMKTGAGYVPLDPGYPDDRLKYMSDHSGLRLIVTESGLTARLESFEKQLVAIDSLAQEIAALSDEPFTSSAQPADICYVIYTSGSTGKPKGVQVPHGCVVNFLYSMRQTPGFREDDSVLAVTTLSFDIAVLELYLPTIFGGKVVILDSMQAADGDELSRQLIKNDITLLQATPATWRLMIQSGWKGKDDLKVLCGGEPMPADLVEPLLSRCGELWNMYGPTETTVWSAAYQITSASAPILIGKPIGNTQIYILDPNGNEVPVGCDGEVFIGGAGVTLGYRNRDDLTAERFVENRYRNPFVDYVSDKLYKTGDIARYRFDGNIQFQRRNDKQVKIRGYRIELGEIEQTLATHASVEQNVVIVREDTSGDAKLVAYAVAKPGESIQSSILREHLKKSVPHYMVPQNFVQLESMPQTNNGKIDYKALPVPNSEAPETKSEQPSQPVTQAEKYLAEVWSKVLSTDDVGLNDTFFDIGGHSLLVMKVIADVSEKTGIKLGPQDFLMSTLEQMADMIAESFAFQSQPEVAGELKSPDEAKDTDFVDEAVQNVDASTADEVSPANPGMLKSLKGFWS